MSKWKTLHQTDSGFVEVLTSDKDGSVFGYRLVGAAPGPQLVVVGQWAAAETVFDRLMSIPTLPWMRGRLVLIRTDVLDGMLGDPSSLCPLGNIDRTLILPCANAGALGDADVLRAYHMVLRVCTDLGMISGRGVLRRTAEKQLQD